MISNAPEKASAWLGRPVLVTGAGGFIGSHLVERLLSVGAKVRAFVHYNSRSDWGHLEDVAPGPNLEIMAQDLARQCQTETVSTCSARILALPSSPGGQGLFPAPVSADIKSALRH